MIQRGHWGNIALMIWYLSAQCSLHHRGVAVLTKCRLPMGSSGSLQRRVAMVIHYRAMRDLGRCIWQFEVKDHHFLAACKKCHHRNFSWLIFLYPLLSWGDISAQPWACCSTKGKKLCPRVGKSWNKTRGERSLLRQLMKNMVEWLHRFSVCPCPSSPWIHKSLFYRHEWCMKGKLGKVVMSQRHTVR